MKCQMTFRWSPTSKTFRLSQHQNKMGVTTRHTEPLLGRAVISSRLPCGHRLLTLGHGLRLARHPSLYGVEESGVVILDRKFMSKSLDLLYLTLDGVNARTAVLWMPTKSLISFPSNRQSRIAVARAPSRWATRRRNWSIIGDD